MKLVIFLLSLKEARNHITFIFNVSRLDHTAVFYYELSDNEIVN